MSPARVYQIENIQEDLSEQISQPPSPSPGTLVYPQLSGAAAHGPWAQGVWDWGLREFEAAGAAFPE